MEEIAEVPSVKFEQIPNPDSPTSLWNVPIN
jgi:hypothetical protein